jgi:hypothetical protein
MFRTVSLPIIRSFHCKHSNGICHTGLLTACEQDQDIPSAVSKPVWHILLLCVGLKTPGDGGKNCPKHVEFQSKNKFEKLVHLVAFIIRNQLGVSFIYKILENIVGGHLSVHVNCQYITSLQTTCGSHFVVHPVHYITHRITLLL